MVELNEITMEQKTSVFNQISQMGHEQVVFCHDEATGLRAIIGIHNTTLGPALGGTRMWNYESDEDALKDVLRLSRGMTFKAAVSGLNLGGGKAVIIGDAKSQKSEAFLRRFGKFVNSLNGKYITAEDVNMKTSDMEYIAMETKHVTGLPEHRGGGGDPSPVTAYGTFVGMKAAAKKAYGTDDLSGKRVVVQGVGQVGGYLVKHLTEAGAKVFISDISEERLSYINREYNAEVIAMEDVYDWDMDIYAPCALGATLNSNSIPALRCQVVAGAANNQLEDEIPHGRMLVEQGIVYAPDFVINAGGLINVYAEHLGDYKREIAIQKAEAIYRTTLDILDNAAHEGITPQEAAMNYARKRIEDIGKLKQTL